MNPISCKTFPAHQATKGSGCGASGTLAAPYPDDLGSNRIFPLLSSLLRKIKATLSKQFNFQNLSSRRSTAVELITLIQSGRGSNPAWCRSFVSSFVSFLWLLFFKSGVSLIRSLGQGHLYFWWKMKQQKWMPSCAAWGETDLVQELNATNMQSLKVVQVEKT